MKRLLSVLFIAIAISLQSSSAQDVVLQDTTLAATSTFAANFITVGPDVTIAGTADVLLRVNAVAILPAFSIAGGGKLQVVTDAYNVGIESDEPVIPKRFTVDQNFPNPFSGETQIRIHLPETRHVEVTIYNVLGREIRTLVRRQYAAGVHTVSWNGEYRGGEPLSSGVYYYHVRAGSFNTTRTMILIR